MAQHKGTLFYGGRDHKIHRLKLANFEILPEYETPHFDTVTSMAVLNDSLVTGSRDKSIRKWGVNDDE